MSGRPFVRPEDQRDAAAVPATGGFLYTDRWEIPVKLSTNHVLMVKIEGLVWYTIYHHLPVVQGVNKPFY